jgi:hypothetical protein
MRDLVEAMFWQAGSLYRPSIAVDLDEEAGQPLLHGP